MGGPGGGEGGRVETLNESMQKLPKWINEVRLIIIRPSTHLIDNAKDD